MRPDPPHGTVLVLVEDQMAGELLGRLVAGVGERPVVLAGDATTVEKVAGASPIDLVVTELRLTRPESQATLQKLLAGDLLPDVPRLHLYHDHVQRLEIAEGGPDATSLAMPFPPDLEDFQTRVRLAAEVGRLRRELASTETRDPMTGLSSRTYLLRRLDEEFARATRHRSALSLVLLDIDHLAGINRTFGYTTGDSVVQRFAHLVRTQVRLEDVGGRLSGALFAVVLPGNGYRGAATFAHKVRNDACDLLLEHAQDVHPVHVSAGISTYPDSSIATTPDLLLRAAERALQEAKARGGNRVFIDESVLRHEKRIVLVADPDPELLDLAEDLLGGDDYHVVRADSPRAVLETLRFRKPDLLVIDLHMSDGDSTVPLIEQILALFPAGNFPIIGLSSEVGTTSDKLARLGVDRFITKPFSVSLLRAAARDLLEGSPTA